MSWLEDPFVHAPAHVLDERSEQAAVNDAEREGGIDDEAGLSH
jgi:hypothetical protein